MLPNRHLSFLSLDRWHVPGLLVVTFLALTVIPTVAEAAIGNGSGRDVEYDTQPPDPGGNLTGGESSGRDVEYDVQPSNPGGDLTTSASSGRDVEYDVKPSDPGITFTIRGVLRHLLLKLLGLG